MNEYEMDRYRRQDEQRIGIYLALIKKENWITLNQVTNDYFFFKSAEEANTFACDNISDRDKFSVYHFGSAKEGYQILNNKNLQVMNEENVAYLEKSLLYTGFGDKLNDKLKENIQKMVPEFQLDYKATVGKEETNSKLYFRKSDTGDHYFFNKYDMSFKSSDLKADRSQTFYMDKGRGNITAKEAYNLLAGRSVYKELENKDQHKYNAWLQLNFDVRDKHGNNVVKQYHDNYGYDLKASLAKHSIKDMDTPNTAEMLLKSLEKGNLHSVIMNVDGKNVKQFIEANPQYKSVNIYDGDMKLRMNKSQNQEQGQEKKQDQKLDVREDKKKELAAVKEQAPEKDQSKSKGRGR